MEDTNYTIYKSADGEFVEIEERKGRSSASVLRDYLKDNNIEKLDILVRDWRWLPSLSTYTTKDGDIEKSHFRQAAVSERVEDEPALAVDYLAFFRWENCRPEGTQVHYICCYAVPQLSI